LFTRAVFGAGIEVTVHSGHLMLKPLTPIPAMRQGMRLYPDDPADPRVFRVESPEYGTSLHVAFSGKTAMGPGTERLLLEEMLFQKRPDLRNPRRWVNAVAVAGAAGIVIRHYRASSGR
jgi:hypothetical protein